jgi:hypothetical protein
MNSREFDGMLDDLLQQALHPFAEAEPPARGWRRVLRSVRSKRDASAVSAERPWLAGIPVLIELATVVSSFRGFFSGMRWCTAMYVPLFPSRVTYVYRNGAYLPAPLWELTVTQMFGLRLVA